MNGTNPEINLDQLCAKAGDALAREASRVFNDPKKADALLTKALGVAQEQGLYALFLFLECRSGTEAKAAEAVRDGSLRVLQDAGLVQANVRPAQVLEILRRDDGLLGRLEDLLLAVELISRSLTYARFHAKALRTGATPPAWRSAHDR